MGQTHIVDSVVYLTGLVFAGAALGSFQIPATNRGEAFVSKYVDTSFMTPYVYNDPRVEQAIEWGQDLSFSLTDSPVTLTATATSGLPVTYHCADTSVARINGNTLHLLSNGTTTVTAYQNGNEYGYYPATPVSKTLTVSAIGTDVVGQPTFYIYPNPTKGTLFINVSDEQITNVHMANSLGQQTVLSISENVVSLSDFPSGIYYIQVITNKNIYQQKIIKL